MALFLSEAVNNYERKQISRGTTDLAEAALTLLSISEQSAALSEAVMTAEFTLMRQCQNLSEGETSNKMKDFGRKVWYNLKAFAKTVWAKIKEICRMVWRKLKEWGSQVLDMFSGKEMEILKHDQKYLEQLPRIMEKAIREVERGISASDDSGSDWADRIGDIRSELKSVQKEAEKDKITTQNKENGKAYARVGKNWLKSIQSTLTNYANRLEKATDMLDKTLENYDKVADRMSHEDNQKDLSKNSAKMNTAIGLLKETAGELVTAANKLAKVGRSVNNGENSDHAKVQKELKAKLDALLKKYESTEKTLYNAVKKAQNALPYNPDAVDAAIEKLKPRMSSSDLKELERLEEKGKDLKQNSEDRNTENTARHDGAASHDGYGFKFTTSRK